MIRDFTTPDGSGEAIKERGAKAEQDRIAQLEAQIARLQGLIDAGPSAPAKEEEGGISPALKKAIEEAKVARGEKGTRMDQAQVLGLVDLVATARAAGVPAEELRGLVKREDLIAAGILMTPTERREARKAREAEALKARRERFAEQKKQRDEYRAAYKERVAKKKAEREQERLDKAIANEQSPDFVGPRRPDGASPTAPAAAAPTTPAAPAAATPAAPAAATPAAPATSATPAAAGGIGSFQDVLDMVQDFGPEPAKAAAAAATGSSAPGPGITKPTAAESTPNTPQAAIAGAGQTPPGMQPQGPKDASVVDQPLPGLGQNDPSGPRVQGNLTDRDMELLAGIDKGLDDLGALADKAEKDADGEKLMARVRKARLAGAQARAKADKAEADAKKKARLGGDGFMGAALEEIGRTANQFMSYFGVTEPGTVPFANAGAVKAPFKQAAQGFMDQGAQAGSAFTSGVPQPPR